MIPRSLTNCHCECSVQRHTAAERLNKRSIFQEISHQWFVTHQHPCPIADLLQRKTVERKTAATGIDVYARLSGSNFMCPFLIRSGGLVEVGLMPVRADTIVLPEPLIDDNLSLPGSVDPLRVETFRSAHWCRPRCRR